MKSTRLISENHFGDQVTYAIRPTHYSTGLEKINVIGYAEVTKASSFSKMESMEEFVDYLESHDNVKYIHWFEDRIEGGEHL